MTEPLFREEAVEHVRRGGGRGDVVRVAPRWTAIAFWVLAALAVAGLAAAALVPVDQVKLVPAVAQGARVLAAAPAGTPVTRGEHAEFALTKTGERVGVRIVRVGVEREGAVPVLARADEPIRGPGVVELTTGQRPLIAELLPGR